MRKPRYVHVACMLITMHAIFRALQIEKLGYVKIFGERLFHDL